MTRGERLLLLVLACINFTHIVDFMIMMPLGPQLMRYFGIGPQEFALIVSSYSLSAGISGFVAAFFVDRFPRKYVVMLAYSGFVVGTLACAIAPTYWLLIAARALAGIFGGVLGSQVLSIVGDVFSYERRAQAMSIVMTAFSAASVAGVPFGLYIATRFSWHAPFVFVGVLGIGVLFLIWRFVPIMNAHVQSRQQRTNPFAVLTNIASNPNQLRALFLTTTIMLGHFSIIPFITPYLVSNVGFSESNVYLIYLVGGALTIFTAPLVGRIADQKGKYPVFVVFALLSLLPIYLITHMPPSPLAYVLFVSGLFFIFSNGRLVPTQAMVTSVVSPVQRGGFMAINSSVQLLAQSLAAYSAGLIVGKTPEGQVTNYGLVGFFAITAIFLSIFIARQVKPIDAAPQPLEATAP
ncbi:MFS transporter [Telluribacter sp.]|jgi:predicted MFS family arabinose efflux permease|uniref:MFS transporter n=1 Tax=Telluribacter sp. TaxID=1978767 RepID=UPI002E1417AE|nr:MFS transporter [Telluribacter sp.]